MLKNVKKKRNNKGFTLVELLVVIAIIGILAVVAVPSLFKNIDKAKSTQVSANIKAIQTEVLSQCASGKTTKDISDSTTETPEKLVTDLVKESSDAYEFIKSTDTVNYVEGKVKLKVTLSGNAEGLNKIKEQFKDKCTTPSSGSVVITLY